MPTHPPESGRVRPNLFDDKEPIDLHPITRSSVACGAIRRPACLKGDWTILSMQRNWMLSNAGRRLDLHGSCRGSDNAPSCPVLGVSRRRVWARRVPVRSEASMPRRLALRARGGPPLQSRTVQ